MNHKDKNAILEVIQGATVIKPGEYLTFSDSEGEQLFIPLDIITKIEKGVAYDESDKEEDPEELGFSITTTGEKGDRLYKYTSSPMMITVIGLPLEETITQPQEDFFQGIEQVLQDLHYKVEKNDGKCIVAYSTHLWDEEHNYPISVDHKRKLSLLYDDKDGRIFFGIREDYDTRYVFNGEIDCLDDIKWIDAKTRILPHKIKTTRYDHIHIQV